MADQENEAQLEDLSPDVMDGMCLFIPLEPLMKFKLRSTTLDALITDFRRRHTPISNTGLVIVLHHIPRQENREEYHESIFGPLQELLPSLGWQHQPLNLRGSCNGLLLYDGCGPSWTILDYFQRRLITVNKNHEWGQHCSAQVGIASEGIRYNFQLVRFLYKEVDRNDMMKCEIYSSESAVGSPFLARIHNSGLAVGEGFNRDIWSGTSLYYGGRLYWIWSICMLRYEIGSRTFVLFSLPPESNQNFAQLLYESDGQIYFCCRRDDSLHIFAFVARVGGWEPWWTLGRQERIDGGLAWSELWPLGFNQDLQLLFLYVGPKRIVSYSLETGRFAEVWTCEETEGYDTQVVQVLPLLLKSVPSSRKWKAIIPPQ